MDERVFNKLDSYAKLQKELKTRIFLARNSHQSIEAAAVN